MQLYLKEESTLQGGKYRIVRVLGQGGFGITYLAAHTLLDKQVAIKEFFPKIYCDRDESTSRVMPSTASNAELATMFKAKFIKEARNIARFDYPGIVKIHDVFEENNTAYYVMDYIEGESLGMMVERQGRLPEAKAVSYVLRVGAALAYIHSRRMNHLDVKPANIMVRREDDMPVLIDFGLSKQYDASGGQTSTTPVGISPGYAPMEQYRQGGVSTFTPQTDVYSLGATLYKLVTGTTPLEATELSESPLTISGDVSGRVAQVILKAMSTARADRYATVAEFCGALGDEGIEEDGPKIDGHTGIGNGSSSGTSSGSGGAVADGGEYATVTPSSSSRKRYAVAAVVAVWIFSCLVVWRPWEDGSKEISAPRPAPSSNTISSSATEIVNGKTIRWASGVTDGQKNILRTLVGNMVYVAGGTFSMGSDDSDAYSYEKPVHTETVGDFWINKYEVTQKEWQAVMNNNPSNFKGDNLPVERVSWDDCQKFIRKLNELTGLSFRLPTEPEWEYAAKGGNRSRNYKYSGSNSIGEVAWYDGNSGSKTHAVGTKSANELGLYDMSGNIREMTASLWCNDYNSARTGSVRVYRGGSWCSNARSCRSSFRYYITPGCRNGSLGLRLVL